MNWYFLRVIIASTIIILLFGATVFGLAWIIYEQEWRTEQMRVQNRYATALDVDKERMLISNQVNKMEESGSLSMSDIKDIISSFITTYYAKPSDVPPADITALYWTYPNSVWYVTCLLMSMEPLPGLNITSAMTLLFSMNFKIIGPTISVVTIASMAAAINWLFCMMLYCVAHKPKNLPDCLTAKYQRNLLIRDALVMVLTVCLFLATLALGAYLYTLEVRADFWEALCGVLSFVSLTATFNDDFESKAKNSIMEILFWMSLLLILQSSLAACLTSMVRVYRTWLTMNDVVATPAELRAYLEKERIQKRNQLIYHAKAE